MAGIREDSYREIFDLKLEESGGLKGVKLVVLETEVQNECAVGLIRRA